MYHVNRRKLRRPQYWLIFLVIVLLAFLGVAGFKTWYSNNLKPVSANQHIVYFTVSKGESTDQIAANLERSHLIRSAAAFKSYVRGHQVSNLQAGTYELSQSMSVKDIIKKMSKGEIAKNLLTILPGKRLDEIEAAFVKAGYTQAQVDAAFNPALYTDHPVLATLPAGASLEGYLYPDSFQKDASTPADVIVRESLDEMQKYLSPDILNGFTAQGLNLHQGVTLASIVLKETGDPASEPTVAQVFLTRLKKGMMLGSDVTAHYATDIAHQPVDYGVDSPYNTRIHTGLPPGPIANVTGDALKAVAHPANTDYLFFVAGDDDKIHFTHTQKEHDAAIREFCKTKCAQ